MRGTVGSFLWADDLCGRTNLSRDGSGPAFPKTGAHTPSLFVSAERAVRTCKPCRQSMHEQQWRELYPPKWPHCPTQSRTKFCEKLLHSNLGIHTNVTGNQGTAGGLHGSKRRKNTVYIPLRGHQTCLQIFPRPCMAVNNQYSG
jgi:hypothetical protein